MVLLVRCALLVLACVVQSNTNWFYFESNRKHFEREIHHCVAFVQMSLWLLAYVVLLNELMTNCQVCLSPPERKLGQKLFKEVKGFSKMVKETLFKVRS